MPWGHKTVEELREEFVERASRNRNFSALCREYKITRATGYKWIERAKQGEGFANRSHAPQTIANKTDEEIERGIVRLREENPGWGGKKLRKVMENQGAKGLPCVKTFSNILKRNGCITEEASQAHVAHKRFEREKCNDLWQTDFKGDFALLDDNRCYPLTILDDHSRFLIKIAPKPDLHGVTESFREAFQEYGMPNSVLSDNGGTFRGLHGGFTGFERWLMEHDVLPIHGRVRHPQTQGKIERMHGAMEAELLKHKSFSNLQAAAEGLEEWREKYNHVRPHEALGMKCPAQIFTRSSREYLDTVEDYQYTGEFRVVKVNAWGYVRFADFQTFLSETFAGELIEFRANPLGGSWIACFRNFRIAEFDIHTGKLLNRFTRRLSDAA